MKLLALKSSLPSWKNALLAVISAILLILAFPDFEYWFLAWFGLVPLLIAIEREKESASRSAILGWIWGVVFFFGTCWWLTYAPIHYAGFPVLLAYFLLFCAVAVVSVFPGLFAAVTSVLRRRFGSWAFLAIPFVWVATEFARYWLTGNNWNAIGYSQAFGLGVAPLASFGGIQLVSVGCLIPSTAVAFALLTRTYKAIVFASACALLPVVAIGAMEFSSYVEFLGLEIGGGPSPTAKIIAIQPNVPMSGLNDVRREVLKNKQVESAATEIKKLRASKEVDPPLLVVLPESPMNFIYDEDSEFQQFIGAFAWRNYTSVLINSAEPDKENNRYFNSAVLIDASGRKVAQYDKIYLLPFGEAVPFPLESLVPAFVGNFSYGKNYSLVPLGDAKGGIMICFESHFGQLSREYVRRGADAIIEMTNDGYLGATPVLRQHLANAVFRAIETNRPVLRVTNVGITAYITERGEVLDATLPYTEDTRVWPVAKSDGNQTLYVKYGDWFAWVCTIFTVLLLAYGLLRNKAAA